MLCEKCHEQEAAVHITCISKGEMKKLSLCVVCAPAEEQMKQDPIKALGADWPKDWPKPPSTQESDETG